MIKKVLTNLFILFLLIPQASFGEKDKLQLLFFFSATCPKCIEVMPYIKEISKEFSVKGLLYGKKEMDGLPFPVEKGTREMADKYGIKGVPALVVFEDGVFKQRFIGVSDIKDSMILLRGFRMGALSVSETLKKMPEGEFIITGWIIHRGRYFDKDSSFFITDRQEAIEIKPWLPIEATKSPFKKNRPRLMSDVINKPVVLKGRILRKEAGYIFTVSKEIN